MLWYIMVGSLAAFGALCALYIVAVLFTRHLPGSVMLCRGVTCRQELMLITRHSRLYALGLLKCPLIMIDSSFTPKEQQLLCKKHPNLMFYTQADYIACFSGEKDHAGTADPTRHHPNGGVPEL